MRENLKKARIASGMTQQQVADRIKRKRLEKAYTQLEISNLINVDLDMYLSYENGEKLPSLIEVVAIADILEVSLDYLLCRDNYINNKTKSKIKRNINPNISKEKVIEKLDKLKIMHKFLYDDVFIVCENGDIYKKLISGDYRLQNCKPSYENGYPVVSTRINKKQKTFLVHRLVAEAFLDNPFNYDTIDHIDGNKTNNSVDNLEWCTQKENNRRARDRHKEQYRTNMKNIRISKNISVSKVHYATNIMRSRYFDLENGVIKEFTEKEKRELELFFCKDINYLLSKADERE